ncbi:hypothetical protein N5853_09240 [Bartonella sp. HY329]|uniref:hypothetical protein n=1 Tax=unclassified Bartonella TaxID=2645622 RepID=UPI0021CA0845|nr:MULTISPECIES: hypothetical protein [unclassified Bartonella]UXM94290.1 hypothetical protein N5853_09240 [Bartonella sp. HY329]UXN08613.1 hypothetical protein N5852_09250 [Bartonella sp. HY328]
MTDVNTNPFISPPNTIWQQGAAIHPIPTRCHAMMLAMQDIAAAKGNVDVADLKNAGFADDEIATYGEKAASLAQSFAVKAVCKPKQNLPQVPLIIAASEATPPQFDNIINNDKIGNLWRNYCACVAAFKLHPWYPLRERCIAMLAQYLAAVNIGQASRAAIIRQVEAHLRAIPLCQKV